MGDIVVDPATVADWNDLLALWAADETGSARGLQVWSPDEFLACGGFWVLLARMQGEAVGFAHVCLIPKADARRGFLFVDELFVHPAHRRRGVATALLDRVLEMSDERGLAGVRLLVRPENAAARALYQKAGFQEYPTLLCRREARPSL